MKVLHLISSEIGTGTTFISISGETGLVVPPNDPPALRGAMQYLWEHPEDARIWGRRAEERYWKYFTAERMATDYIKIYRELMLGQGDGEADPTKLVDV